MYHPGITDISAVANLKYLQRLDLRGCRALDRMDVLRGLPLRVLRLGGCVKLYDVSWVTTLIYLGVLDLQGCEMLADIKYLQDCECLEVLDLSGCKGIPDLGIITQISTFLFFMYLTFRQ